MKGRVRILTRGCGDPYWDRGPRGGKTKDAQYAKIWRSEQEARVAHGDWWDDKLWSYVRIDGHELWHPNDPSAPAVAITLDICKRCGAAESELDDFTCLEYRFFTTAHRAIKEPSTANINELRRLVEECE